MPTRHPDKNGNSAESTERFQDVNAAYARLTMDEDDEDGLDDVFDEEDVEGFAHGMPQDFMFNL